MVHIAWLGKKSPFCGNVSYGNLTTEQLKNRRHKVSFIHFDNPFNSNESKPLFLANDPEVSLPYLIKYGRLTSGSFAKNNGFDKFVLEGLSK